MANQRRRLEKALRGCAEAGVPDTMDLWRAVRERVAGERVSTELTGQGESNADPRRRIRVPRLVPNTPVGWVLAAVSVLIIGVGVYAAAEPVREFYRQGLPGTVEPGSKKTDGDRGTRPGAEQSGLKTEIDQTRTAQGAKVTLDWAYADERFVMVGLDTEDLDGAQKSDEFDSDFGPVLLQPAIFDDTVGNEAELPPYVRISDESDQDFDTIDGGTLGAGRALAIFDAPEGLDPGRKHRFRLEVPLQEGGGISGSLGEKPDAGPFVFGFEVPVLPAPAIEVNQEVEAKGITLTLKRVINSPGRPQAVVCVEPPDDEHLWTPWIKYAGGLSEHEAAAPQELEDGCWSLTLGAPIEGARSSATVIRLDGMPLNTPSGRVETVRGPWTFEFEVPGR